MTEFCAECLSSDVVALIGQIAEGTGIIVRDRGGDAVLETLISRAHSLGLVEKVPEHVEGSISTWIQLSITRAETELTLRRGDFIVLTTKGLELWGSVAGCTHGIAITGRSDTRIVRA